MPVWPFQQLAPFSERAAWATSVLRAPNGEQRNAARPDPIITMSSSHQFTPQELSTARALIDANDSFQVPNWARVLRVGAVSAGTDVLISIDTTDSDLAVNAEALLWQSANDYEVVTVVGLNSGDVTLGSVVGNYTDARLMPLFNGVASGGLNVQRAAGNNIKADVDFYLDGWPTLSTPAYTQYRNVDLLLDDPIVSGGAFSEPLRWEYTQVGGDTSPAEFYRNRDLPERAGQMRWVVNGRDKIHALRQFIYLRRGQQKAFWFSTRNNDFLLDAPIASTDTQLTVAALPGVVSLPASFDIEIKTQTGASFYRQVTGVTSGSSQFFLPIDSPIGASYSIDEISRISILHCMRFARDIINFDYQASARGPILTVAVQLIECPLP